MKITNLRHAMLSIMVVPPLRLGIALTAAYEGGGGQTFSSTQQPQSVLCTADLSTSPFSTE